MDCSGSGSERSSRSDARRMRFPMMRGCAHAAARPAIPAPAPVERSRDCGRRFGVLVPGGGSQWLLLGRRDPLDLGHVQTERRSRAVQSCTNVQHPTSPRSSLRLLLTADIRRRGGLLVGRRGLLVRGPAQQAGRHLCAATVCTEPPDVPAAFDELAGQAFQTILAHLPGFTD